MNPEIEKEEHLPLSAIRMLEKQQSLKNSCGMAM